MADANRFYRRLLRLYPARFREQYGAPLERQFADEYGETRTGRERALLWMRTARDLLQSVPAQVAREFVADVRYALRVYARRPLVSLLALSALTLAIGATTGVFSVVNALLLRSLPFRDADRLVQLSPPHGGFGPASGFHAWRRSTSYLDDAASYWRAEMNLTADSGSSRVRVAETCFNFFSMLGVQPIVGRAFAEGEDRKGGEVVAVIGYGLFQQLFGGDARALGQRIQLSGQPVTIIGVAPPGFDYPSRSAVWTPTVFDVTRLPKTAVTFIETIGRLKGKLSLAQASAMFEAEHAGDNSGAPRGYRAPRPQLIPVREQLAGNVRQASLVLMGAVGFILLIACANVANLLLTRVAERRTELTIRATLGASRARLVQQLVTESLAIAVLAMLAGLLVAGWASRLATAAEPAQVTFQQYSILDLRVLAFAAVVAVLTALVFGVLPATMAGRLHPAETLVRHQAGSSGRAASQLRLLLLAGQVALTIALLAGSFVMVRGFLALVGTDLGFRTRNVVTMNLSLAGTPYGSEGKAETYFHEALARLRGVAGVSSAGAVDFLPLVDTGYMMAPFGLEGGGPQAYATMVSASADYFRTMGTEILFGREFSGADRRDSERVAVVNDAFIREIGASAGDVVGRRLVSKLSERLSSWAPLRVVGVVRSARYGGPAREAGPQVFTAAWQRSPLFMTLVARVDNPGLRLAMARDAVQSADRLVPVFGVQTLDDYLGANLARSRFYTETILFLGMFALLLSIVGIYAISSYSIAQRTHEIGVRLAIGASTSSIRTMLLRQSLVPVGVGAAIGIPAALGAGRYISHLVAVVQPPDATTCAVSALVLVLVAAVAVWSAIRRVIRSNPLDALHAE